MVTRAKVYSNGVVREEVQDPRNDLALTVLEAIRGGCGRWGIRLAIRGNVYLSDGRRLPVDREVSLNLAQVGRKRRKA